MKDSSKINQELIEEISALKQRIEELEHSKSERKQAEQERNRLMAVIESAPDFIGFADAKTKRISYINQAGRRMCGIGEHENINALQIADVHPEWANRLLEQKILPATVQEGVWQGECAFVDRHGLEIPVLMVLMTHRSGTGDMDFFSTISRNITDRKHAEEALRRAHDELEQRVSDRTEELMLINKELQTEITGRKRVEDVLRESEENYRNLFDHANEAIFVAQDGKLVFLNPMTTRLIGYSGEDLMSKSFVEFIHPDDQSVVLDRHVKRLKGEELPQIYSFRIVRGDSKVIWVDLNTVVVNWKGKPATLNFLSDITDRKQAEEQLQQTLESLRKAVGVTIQVLTSAVETRDPYTAGHQTRSADLARAIGTEMELPQEKIDTIRIASSIHDIGKLSIPAEILSKPNKLSEIEFSLIKEHSRKGFEMLKDVESPWPLADIIYQHHERMDGSGYPRNLKGEEICIEARILAVADVVEAMASHRPYRPGLGIDAALNEIEKNRGIIYDNAVVDACLRLFREKGFQLAEA
jgi:PAS domain S-box-containing protein